MNAANDKTASVEIYDTTLRDGTQTEGISLSLEDKLLIAAALDGLGVDYIEGGYPLSNPKDEAFFEEARRRPFRHAKLAAFGMTRRKGVKAKDDEGMIALLKTDAPVITIVGKCWDLHLRDVLEVSDTENLAMIADTVTLLAAAGREVFFDAEHFFDGFRSNPALALRVLRQAHQAGASRLVLCDTNGGALPQQVAAAVQAVAAELPGALIGVHCHNDGDLAVANSLAAVAAGACQVQGTVNGIGERCGNADLISVIGNLVTKCGRSCLVPGTIGRLTETSRYIYEMANLNLRENQPFVGAAAFAHKAGMHVHAVRKNPATYEHIRPETVGNARRILVSELSGVSNIAATVPAKFAIASDKPTQRKVLKALMEREHAGYQFEAAEASFELLIRKTLGEKWYRPLWHLDHYRCVIQRWNDKDSVTEATVKLRTVDGQVRHTVAEGTGPVDSLHRALQVALRDQFGGIADLHLADYKVRVVNTAAETAAKVRVLIDWHDASGQAYFGSVGVSENIVDASWLALVDAVEYKIFRTLEEQKDLPQ